MTLGEDHAGHGDRVRAPEAARDLPSPAAGDTIGRTFRGARPLSNETTPPDRGSSAEIFGFPAGVHSNGSTRSAPVVVFNKQELSAILALYGKMVAAGEWRDYALDFGRDEAVFAVFKRTSDVPLATIVKNPKLARKQGAFSVISGQGVVLKRGHELARVLEYFDKKPKLVR